MRFSFVLTFLSVFSATLFATNQVNANLILNGDFSSGLADWTTSGPVGTWPVAGYGQVTEIGMGAAAGAYISQGFTLGASAPLTLDYNLGEYYGAWAAGSGVFEVIASIFDSSNTVVWTAQSDAYNPAHVNNYEPDLSIHYSIPTLGMGNYTLQFTSTNGWTTVDNIDLSSTSTSAVPEPSSFALAGLGGLGLAIGAYRRRKATAA